MVAQQGREDAQTVPAQHQILGGVAAKAANVGTLVQETAHIQRGHHVQGQQNVAPPRLVVAGPDAAIPVHTDAGRAGVHQDALVRLKPLKSLACSAGHVVAKNIMYFVVPHAALFRVVVEQLIVIFVVGEPCYHAGKGKKAGNVQILLAVLLNFGKSLFQCFLRVEDGRLVHVIPEALDPLIQQELVFFAKPGAGLRVEHIGEVYPPRPHTGDKGGAVLICAEVAVFQPFLIHSIPVLDLDARINDGHKADAVGFHLGGKVCKMREALLVHRKVLVALHVINVQHHGIQRHIAGAVIGYDLADLVLVHVAPAALGVAEGPFGRNIAAPHQLAELVYNVGQAFALNDIEIVIFLGHGDPQGVKVGVAAVKGDLTGVVDKKAEGVFAGHDHKIISTVQRGFALSVVRVIGAFAFVHPTALVNAADIFAQTIQDILRIHGIGETIRLLCQIRNRFHHG